MNIATGVRGKSRMLGRSGIALIVLCGLMGAAASSAPAAAPHKVAWKVLAATGPTHLPPVQSEIQEVTVGGEGGSFTLSHSLSEGTATVNFAGGFAVTTEGSNIVWVWIPLGGTFEVGQEVAGTGIPDGTTIVGITGSPSEPFLELSNVATASGEFTEISASSKELTNVTGHFEVGQEIVGAGIPAATIVTAIGPTSMTISKAPTAGGENVVIAGPPETTGPIPLGASAQQVQAALELLPGYQQGTFSTSGGPGVDPADAYFVAFGGSLAKQEVAEFVALGSGLGEHGYTNVRTSLPGGQGTGKIAIFPTNIGGAASSGPITVDLGPLPAGVVTSGPAEGEGVETGLWTCTTAPSEVECTSENVIEPLTPTAAIKVPVKVQLSSEATMEAEVKVSGGGADQSASYQLPLDISSTPAPAGIDVLYSKVLEADGSPSVQAGGHPYSQATIFALNSVRSGNGGIVPAGELKDANVNLQAGFVGSPLTTPRCPTGEPYYCPYAGETSVGHIYPGANQFGALGLTGISGALHNAVPVPGAAAQFSTAIGQPIATLLGGIRSSEDFGIRVEAPNNSPFLEIFYADTVFFGEPAGADGKAFFRNPTDCAAERQNHPEQSLAVSSWQNPNSFSSKTVELDPVEGCDQLDFEPEFDFQPTSTQGSSGVGATAHLHIDQSSLTDPNSLATPDLKRSVVTLPEGFDINPAQANGLEACSESQVGYEMGKNPLPLNPTRFNEEPVACPDASKLGTAEATSPLLDEPLKGTIYLAAQEENPFDSLIGVYLVFESERFGITLKLPGEVDTESNPGHVTATFDYLPQQPIEDLSLNFRGGGPRSEFATPEVCGTYSTAGTWTPWSAPESGPAAQTSSSFTVSSGCSVSDSARPFHPTFEAGARSPVAGAYSPFVINVKRKDGEQELRSLDFTLPPGETGKLAGIPYCPENAIAAAGAKSGKAEIADPSCPPSSQIGSVDAAAGVGAEPVHVGGKVYLAGPYKGAPISAVVITPAVSGPFDLGDVVIRSPLFVNSETAQVTAKSDPIPTSLRGIPLKLRSVTIELDRPSFALNPTNCEELAVTAAIGSSDGGTAMPANRFQVDGCQRLAFAPKLKLSFAGSTQRTKNPALKAVLTQAPGEANIAKVSVVLPKSEFIDNRHINNPCTRVQFNAGTGNGAECPAKSILGRAKAWTPLLDQPLEGPVYFRSNGGERDLPDLVASLGGQIHVNLVGFIDSVDTKGSEVSRVRTTFATVPDAPVKRFVLQLKGGKQGLLQNSVGLCKAKNIATVRLTAQSGKLAVLRPKISNSCKSGKTKGKSHKRSGGSKP